MRRAVPTSFVFLLLLPGACMAQAATSAAESRTDTARKWEYRVLTKEQLPDTPARDLAAALNKLGDEGWELVTAGSTYIFKRPKSSRIAETARQQVNFFENEVQMWKDRVAWSKRMARKGFASENQVQLEEAMLKEAQSFLERANEELKAHRPEAEKMPKVQSEPQK